MAELRHSSSIGARASSSPMKCDEDSSPLLPAPNPTTSPAAATATARIVTVPSPPTSTPSAPFSPTILGFSAELQDLALLDRLRRPRRFDLDFSIFKRLVKEPPSLWENPLSATTSWKPCAVRRDGGISDLPPENETNGYFFIHAEGGLNQQRIAICNAVAVAKIMNECNPSFASAKGGSDLERQNEF